MADLNTRLQQNEIQGATREEIPSFSGVDELDNKPEKVETAFGTESDPQAQATTSQPQADVAQAPILSIHHKAIKGAVKAAVVGLQKPTPDDALDRILKLNPGSTTSGKRAHTYLFTQAKETNEKNVA